VQKPSARSLTWPIGKCGVTGSLVYFHFFSFFSGIAHTFHILIVIFSFFIDFKTVEVSVFLLVDQVIVALDFIAIL
jgi:hypothetical protein